VRLIRLGSRASRALARLAPQSRSKPRAAQNFPRVAGLRWGFPYSPTPRLPSRFPGCEIPGYVLRSRYGLGEKRLGRPGQLATPGAVISCKTLSFAQNRAGNEAAARGCSAPCSMPLPAASAAPWRAFAGTLVLGPVGQADALEDPRARPPPGEKRGLDPSLVSRVSVPAARILGTAKNSDLLDFSSIA